MTVEVLPDLKQAIIDKLLSISPVATIVSNRIGGAFKKGVQFPGPTILLRLAGSSGDDYETGIQFTRVDMEFYGISPDDSMLLWRTTHPYLCVNQANSGVGIGQALNGFKKDNCRIIGAEKESGPGEFQDDDTKFYFTAATYIFMWQERRV